VRKREIVGYREVDAGHMITGNEIGKTPRSASCQRQGRLAAREVYDTHVAPENAPAEPRAKRLGASLLRGESLRIGCGASLPAVGFCPFRVGEYPVEKAISILLDGALYAPDINHVAADAEYHASSN
jgi:hypothetical protein